MKKIGCFKVHEPVPKLREPLAFASLKPWIDVNGVGSLILKELEARLGATELAVLSKPGNFYDFTRYRPTVRIDGGIRDLSVPTTSIHYARREEASDVILLRLLEPHASAEVYVDSVLKLLQTLEVKKYILLGSMHDMVPHTRPVLLSGYGMGKEAREDVKRAGALPIIHNGPSSIVNLVSKKAAEAGIEVISLIASLPQYVVLEEDHLGKVRLLEALNMLYDLPLAREDFDRALEQRKLIDERVDDTGAIKALLPELERMYDARVQAAEAEGTTHLTSEMEEIFWSMMGKDVGKA